MKILITNHHLVNFGGTEVFTLELAKGLFARGHEVTVYSKFINKLLPFFSREHIPTVSDLSLIKTETFDIAHVHHNISAIEVRAAFPTLPIFYLSHGLTHFLEQPSALDLNISLFGGVSQHIVRTMNAARISKKKTVLFHNIIDEKRFYPTHEINVTPKRALLLSAKIDEKKEQIIRSACKKLNIKLECIGGRFGEVPYYDIPKYINKADIVFTIGRGVPESMMCGRIPVIFDMFGGDGMVSTQNFSKLIRKNFSGRTYKKHYTVAGLIREIKKYRKESGEELRKLTCTYFGVSAQIPRIEQLYKRTIATHRNKKINKAELDTYVQTIKASVFYQSRMGTSQLSKDYSQYKQRLEEITSSQFFKLYPLYTGIKKYFVK